MNAEKAKRRKGTRPSPARWRRAWDEGWAPPGGLTSGFTLMELVVALAIVGVLLTALLDRLSYYQELAEKASMDYVRASVKTGLQLRMAELIATNREANLYELERDNPMRWIEGAPANYLGEYPDKPSNRSWYYDTGKRHLVYVPGSSHHLESSQEITAELRFQPELSYEADAVSGRRRAVGVALVPTGGFKWF
jgi:prepilin-type N-terminal cleavage/methylation domain-containing protein